MNSDLKGQGKQKSESGLANVSGTLEQGNREG